MAFVNLHSVSDFQTYNLQVIRKAWAMLMQC